MARDVFHMTLSNTDADDKLVALEGIQVSAFKRGTTDPITIYQRPTGATQGPTPESGSTGGPNPFTTGPSGSVEFWADGPAEVDVFIHDTVGPSRIADRTFGWNAVAVGVGSLPSASLAPDAGIALAMLGPDVLRQMHAIGQVIDWWRPQASVPLPSGFEVCDGRQIPAGQHDFPGLGASAINLPDLRNMFILGALPTNAGEGAIIKAHAAGAGQGNAPGDAPGIVGNGGSNAAKNFAHGHGVPGVSHAHLTEGVNHLHTVGSLYTGDHAHGGPESITGPYHRTGDSNVTLSRPWGIAGSGAVGIGGATGAVDRALGAWSGAPNVSLNTATNSTAWTEDPGSDMRPRFIGLLKLMKVRRA